MVVGQVITLRLRIQDLLPGVAYSLQTKKNEPAGRVTAGDGPISFDVPVRVAPGPKFHGDFVRGEAASRRFVYIAIGEQAGQRPSPWSRRAQIDIHLPSAELPGEAEEDGPACATGRPVGAWRVVE